MKLLIQWATDPPADWVTYDLTTRQQIGALPDKGVPVGGEVLDSTPGWVAAINCQGVILRGFDHYGGDISGTGLVMAAWYDTGPAVVWTFLIPKHDPLVAGPNTDQLLTVYTDSPADWATHRTTAGPAIVLPWASFPTPGAQYSRHGIAHDEIAHASARSLRGWQEWVT